MPTPAEPPGPEPNPYEPPRAVGGSSPRLGEAIGRLMGRLAQMVVVGMACLFVFVATCCPLGAIVVNLPGGEPWEKRHRLVWAMLIGLIAAIRVGFGLIREIRGRGPREP